MTALKKTGDAFNEMGGRLMDELPAAGWDSFADMLHVYRGVASAFPEILTMHKVISTTYTCVILMVVFLNSYRPVMFKAINSQEEQTLICVYLNSFVYLPLFSINYLYIIII